MIDVYIVDDSELLQERVIALIAENPNLNFIGQSDRSEGAVANIRAVKPDVVILDIRLGDGSGIDVLKELRADPDCPIIIMFTNYPITQYRERCLEYGADYFVEKSSGSKILARTLQNISQRPKNHNSGKIKI